VIEPSPPPPDSSGKAIASLVLGILGVVSCGVLGIIALVLGKQAQGEIAGSGGRLTGQGMADAGVVLGWISVAILMLQVLGACLFFGLGLAGASSVPGPSIPTGPDF